MQDAIQAIVLQLLDSNAALNLAALAVGGAFTLVQGSKWYQTKIGAKKRRAVEFVELAVNETFETYVRARKAASVDGKLTSQERETARRMARDAAIGIAKSEGVDLVADIGEAVLQNVIQRTVTRAKANEQTPQTVVVQTAPDPQTVEIVQGAGVAPEHVRPLVEAVKKVVKATKARRARKGRV